MQETADIIIHQFVHDSQSVCNHIVTDLIDWAAGIPHSEVLIFHWQLFGD